MSTQKELAIRFTAKEKAELVPVERSSAPLQPKEVAGRTCVSLVSSGTEVVGTYSGTHYQISESSYPMSTGYATVFQVEEVGSEVQTLAKGDLVLGGSHQSFQRRMEGEVVKVPDGLAPETAVFARMVKISMPAFVRSAIRPPEILMVTGLGAVGTMAAQVGQLLGYQVAACDPSEKRRRIAERHGIRQVLPAVPVQDPQYAKKVGFGLDCSGHEQAVLDLCSIVRVWGEVALVGVPWVARTPMLAQKILHSVFYNYVNLKSGWEGQVPPPANMHSGACHHAAALRWLAEGRIKVEPCAYRKVPPTDPQQHYQDLLHNRVDELTVLFDWRQM